MTRLSRETVKKLDDYMRLSYRIEIIPVHEDGGVAFRCPELLGCITCADAIEHGLTMLEDAKRCWFAACLEDGIEIPESSAARKVST